MNNRLQEIINCVPLFKQASRTDCAICVWDHNGVVQAYFKSAELDIKFEVGFKVPDPNDPIYQAINTGKQIYNKLPKEAFGVAFEGTITPIFDGTTVVGVLTYCVASEKKDEIIYQTEKLANSIEHTDNSLEKIASRTTELAHNMAQVKEFAEIVREQVEEASSVVATIQKNANYSNILALNASIESARAGQAGRGFAVVSDEMRKFSTMSGEAATKIHQNLSEIVKSLDSMRENIGHSTEIASEQAEAVSHLNEKFDTVIAASNCVNEICKTHTGIN